MTTELAFRLLGAIVFAVIGWRLGSDLRPPFTLAGGLPIEIFGALVGLILGALITPYLTTRPARYLVENARRLPFTDLLAVVIGLLVGLILSALLAVPLSQLPGILGEVLPLAVCLFVSYLGIAIAAARREEILGLIGQLPRGESESSARERGEGVLLDTSAIIDGRIVDIGRVGFLDGPVVVPRFVLRELQRIADSSDAMRRGRGRRGLELLERLKKIAGIPVRIYDGDAEGDGVDAKLVSLAQKLRCAIVTNDYNLNRVAAVQGVRVLNVNELANAVKTAVLPGEELNVRVIQEGKEPNQGVAYLDDGTMVVVDGGRRYLDTDIGVVVTRVFQTAAGRMIFAQTRESQRETLKESSASS
ncbi:MAG TPA: PIN domain-containing protein [Chloroflexota bacterium]|nr:PIN domain-containing protein [Chloroflexota bacterium]